MHTTLSRIQAEIAYENLMLAHRINRARALELRGARRSELGRRILSRYEAERRAATDRIALLKQSARDIEDAMLGGI